ncbi:hypothetical protein D1AOALGA4SA_475 [Olavius algarvensis Delta 1 endosymbiont]|nr:hypothetical protein D1AOALGA4SA_475 [Olavius algarvensis Delta 1 endosymbiont]
MKEFIRNNRKAYIIGIATYIVLSIISWIYWEFLVSNGIIKIKSGRINVKILIISA